VRRFEPSPFTVCGVLFVGLFGIWRGAWLGYVIGAALIGVDVALNWLGRPVKRRRGRP
jgi:hypothetical protein